MSKFSIHRNEHLKFSFKFPKYIRCIPSHIIQLQKENEIHGVSQGISKTYSIKFFPAFFKVLKIWQA